MNDVERLIEQAKEDRAAWNFLLARILELTGRADLIQKLNEND